MTSMWPMFVTIFSCCYIIEHFTVADDIQDLYFLNNGYFNNFDQDKEEGGRHDRLEMWLKPVNVPQLKKKYVSYCEEAINGSVYRIFLNVFTKVQGSPVIMVKFYNFTDTRKYKPGSFNTSDLANIPLNDFDSTEGCESYQEKFMPGIFTGNVMDCRRSVNGQHTFISTTTMCDGIRFEPPIGSKETPTLLSYYLKRKGHRYPVPPEVLPKDYVGPCKDTM